MAEPAPPAEPVVAAAAAPAAAPTPAPVVEVAPVAAPVIEAAPAAAEPIVQPVDVPSLLDTVGRAAPEAAPAAEPAKVEEAPKAEEAKPAAEPAKVEEAKPAEAAKAAEEPKPAEAAKPVEAPKLDPIEYKYTIPEILTMDDAQKGEFNTVLDEFRANPAEGGQKLIDLHVKSLTAFAEKTLADQYKTFNKMRSDWQTEIKADPVLGGAGYLTAMDRVARARDAVISDFKPGTPEYKADLEAFDKACRTTGAGDNPVIVKMFWRMARFLKEPEPPPPGGKPPASNGVNPNRTKSERMYPNTNFGQRKAS